MRGFFYKKNPEKLFLKGPFGGHTEWRPFRVKKVHFNKQTNKQKIAFLWPEGRRRQQQHALLIQGKWGLIKASTSSGGHDGQLQQMDFAIESKIRKGPQKGQKKQTWSLFQTVQGPFVRVIFNPHLQPEKGGPALVRWGREPTST